MDRARGPCSQAKGPCVEGVDRSPFCRKSRPVRDFRSNMQAGSLKGMPPMRVVLGTNHAEVGRSLAAHTTESDRTLRSKNCGRQAMVKTESGVEVNECPARRKLEAPRPRVESGRQCLLFLTATAGGKPCAAAWRAWCLSGGRRAARGNGVCGRLVSGRAMCGRVWRERRMSGGRRT